MSKHGTMLSYRLGCRCGECRDEAHAQYVRQKERLGSRCSVCGKLLSPSNKTGLCRQDARPLRHGTNGGYQRGCRCAECRAANAEVQRAAHRKRLLPCSSCGRPRTPDAKTGLCATCLRAARVAEHGTEGRYKTCRCDECRAAAAAARRRRRSRTAMFVARNHGRHATGIDLNHHYCRMAAGRLAQLTLAGDAHAIDCDMDDE